MTSLQQCHFEGNTYSLPIIPHKVNNYNIIPHSWHRQIISSSGRPLNRAMKIFAQIVYWYKPDINGSPKFKEDILQTSYKHFADIFVCSKKTISRDFDKLEELGLIKREWRTITRFGRITPNVLFISLTANFKSDGSLLLGSNRNKSDLHESNVSHNNSCPQMNSGDLVLTSSFTPLKEGVAVKREEDVHGVDTQISLTTQENYKKICDGLDKSVHIPRQICPHHIRNENNKKNNKERRSDQRVDALSTYSFSSLDEESACLNGNSSFDSEKNKETQKAEDQYGIFSQISDKAKKLCGTLASQNLKSKPLDWEEGRVLSQLSGISTEETDDLNKRSGREFSLNFINQLILKLGKKYPEHRFFRREQFMNYMVKALMNEILQAPQANNEDFKFACLPKTKDEQYLKQVHKYLDEIESSTNNSLKMRLSKKILGRLEPRLAFEILSGTSLSVCKTGEVDDNDIQLMELEIKILRPLKIDQLEGKEIPEWIERILFEEVRGIYGESVFSKVVKAPSKGYNYWGSKQKTQLNTDAKRLEIDSPLSNSPWDQVRQALRKTYGLATDDTWFKKLKILDSELDPEKSSSQGGRQTTIKIAAPTTFVRDWVSTNYLPVIEQELKLIYPEFKYLELVC